MNLWKLIKPDSNWEDKIQKVRKGEKYWLRRKKGFFWLYYDRYGVFRWFPFRWASKGKSRSDVEWHLRDIQESVRKKRWKKAERLEIVE